MSNEVINTEEKQHPAIYPNSEDPKLTEKIVGEFNKYYTRLKRMYMVSKNVQEKIINDLKIDEITRLKIILKYFLHRDVIDHEAIKFITQIIQEIHNKDYENKKKSEIKKAKPKSSQTKSQYGNNRKFNENNNFKHNSSQSKNYQKPNNSRNFSYDKNRGVKSTFNSYTLDMPKTEKTSTTTSNNSTITNNPEPVRQKKEKFNSHYLRQMKHNNNKQK